MQKPTGEPREYVPTTEEKAFLLEINDQIRNLQMQQEGALRLILKQQKLDGNFGWKVDRLVEQLVEVIK